MNAVQAVHKLLVLRHRYQSSVCSVITQIFIFLRSKPMERRKKFNCFFEFVSIDDLTFRQKQKKIRVTGTLMTIRAKECVSVQVIFTIM